MEVPHTHLKRAFLDLHTLHAPVAGMLLGSVSSRLLLLDWQSALWFGQSDFWQSTLQYVMWGPQEEQLKEAMAPHTLHPMPSVVSASPTTGMLGLDGSREM